MGPVPWTGLPVPLVASSVPHLLIELPTSDQFREDVDTLLGPELGRASPKEMVESVNLLQKSSHS